MIFKKLLLGFLTLALCFADPELPSAPRGSCATLNTGLAFTMFPAHNGIAFGVSLPQPWFQEGAPIPFTLFIENQTDKEFNFATCSTFLDTWDIDVYDSRGQRVLTNAEQREAKGEIVPHTCSWNFGIPIPPHTCMIPVPNGSYALSNQYKLEPGHYLLRERLLRGGKWIHIQPRPSQSLAIDIDPK